MGRVTRLLVGVALIAAGLFLGVYGLFAVFYGGDSGGSGDTYVTLSDRQIDADVVGAIALSISFLVLLAAVLVL
jgi:hypothetical protein